MESFVFGPNESTVRPPFYSLALRPAVPFCFEDEATPWGRWRCDRFAAFFDLASFDGYEDNDPDDALSAFVNAPNAHTAQALATDRQGDFSFDGSLAFIPASHAEDFFSFFETLVAGALTGSLDRPNDTISSQFDLGSDSTDVVCYWGSTVPHGLLLLFSMSCDVLGEDWFSTALERYPKRAEITLPEGRTVFDPNYAYVRSDCHLADHLYPDRDEGNELYASFLAWAQEHGCLRLREDV